MDESDEIVDHSDYDEDSVEESPDKEKRSWVMRTTRTIDESEDATSYAEESSDEEDRSRITRTTRVIEDSEEGTTSTEISRVPSVASSVGDSTEEGRLTPFIKGAIRRSIHQLKKTSDEEDNTSEEESEKLMTDIRYSSDDSENEAIANNTRRVRKVIDESSEDESYRSSIQDTESPSEKHNGSKNHHKRRIVSDDESSEDEDTHRVAEDSAPNSSVSSVEYVDMPKKSPRVIDLDSSAEENKENDPDNHTENDVAVSLAKEETLNTTINPIMAQEQAILVYKQQKLQSQLEKVKMIYETGNMALLPDKGERLRESITSIQLELAEVRQQLRENNRKQASFVPKVEPRMEEPTKPAPLFKQDSLDVDPTYLQPTTSGIDRELGKKAQATLQREQDLTVERLKDLHGSLVARPTEDEQAEDPRGLKIPLMAHQKHALAWLLWREHQKPPGGVLGDDMGLGKTLTMIALVMTSLARSGAGNGSDDEEDWRSSARPQKHLGGTLVVAPASLLAQWEAEVNNRCKRGLITVELYHGKSREKIPNRLAKNDMVVTTYNILSREFKENGVLFKIRWRRVILDEAHVIRNHKSQTCEAVCGLHARKRWTLTGTPVHNKEMDLYAILKFLQCSPFDDLRVWKRWVDNKNAAGIERLATVMKSLMLRRTKAELQAKGALDAMPDKNIEVIPVTLDPEERLVYDKVMVFSRTLFAQFLAQRAEKQHMFELGAGKYDKPSWTTNVKDTQFTKAQKKLLSLHADVKSHEILVLLLRLRQVCCHPPLIKAILDQEDMEAAAIEDGGTDIDLLSKMNNMNISADGEANDEEDYGVDERVTENLLTSDNPVFDANRQSSKMRAVLAKVREILDKGDKMIIVSQWVGVLDVIATELNNVDGAYYRLFTGQVAVKDRQGIMDDFNSRHKDPNVLLLSLTAGGVGLNLVGANHLFLIDIHWNPQLESQAQDRIYRFGQKKDVFIYKYICTDTIEERIQALQEKKLELANAVLSGGGGRAVTSKLSLDDIKSLFSL